MKGIRRFTLFDTKKDAGSPGTSLAKPDKAGYLQTMSGSTSFLSRDKWKKRYFILVDSILYKFSKKEDAKSENVNTQRCVIIGLEGYDICQQDKNDARRQNLFIIDATVASPNQAKLLFSAETKEEMQEWISSLRNALRRPQRPQRTPRATKGCSIPSSLSSHEKDAEDNSNQTEAPSHLYSPTKYRVKGPRGRRLPQKSRYPKEFTEKFRSPSLCELEAYDSNEEIERAEDYSSGINRAASGQVTLRQKSISNGNLAYQYSSSDESLCRKDKVAKKLDKSVESLSQKKPVLLQALQIKLPPKLPENVNDSDALITTSASAAAVKQDPVTSNEGNRSPGPVMLLSAKLTELKGGLARFQRHAKEELMAVKYGLTDIRHYLEEYPTDSTSVDVVTKQTINITTDLKAAEADLATLLEVAQRIETFLQQVQDKCNETFNKLATE